MAVYTKLSEKELKEFFSKYNLGELLNYKEIKEGIENTNYFIQTEKGKFILTLYEKRVEEKDLPFFISLMRNLFDKNFPSPEPIVNKNGNYISEILEKNGIKVIISVPKGKELGPKTDNPRIGIVDGISILGTSGIVMPYSTASFAAAIRQQLDVVLSMGDDTVVLTTGGRSEDFARNIFDLPDHSFVQFGDFSGYTISQCAKKGMSKAHVGGFIGKFAKMATGVKQTHVKGSKVNMDFLSELAKKCKADEDVIQKIKNANTARNVQEIILENNIDGFFDLICSEVYKQMRGHSENKIPIEIILFNFDGNVLARYPKQ